MDTLITKILELLQLVKCNYPNNSIGQSLYKTTFTSRKEIIDSLSNKNTLTDCVSILKMLLLLIYTEDKSFIIKQSDIFKVPDKHFHHYFPMTDKISKGVITYILYEPFHLMLQYFENGLIPISTNSMGFYLLCLGNEKKYYTNYKKYWLGEYVEGENIYLYFKGLNETNSDSGLALSNIEYITNNMIENAKNDWNRLLSHANNKILRDSYDGIKRNILKQNKITMNTVKIKPMGILFELEEPIFINIATMLTNMANTLSKPHK